MTRVVIDKKLLDEIVDGKKRILRGKKLKYGKYKIIKVLTAKSGSNGR